ncbi:ATP-binding protein [Acidiphilium sp. MT5]
MTWVIENFSSRASDGGFSAIACAAYLIRACQSVGIFSDAVSIRRAGVWPGDASGPVANCGDAVFADGKQLAPGTKIGKQIFTAGAAYPHPAKQPAPCEIAQNITREIGELWKFRDDGGAIMAMGLIGAGFLGAAIDWRPNGFITGPSNAGKTSLLAVLRAMTPLHHYSTDTTKAGVESAVNGRAMPIYLDESSDRADAAQNLIDVVLSASSGTGTKLHRGTADGSGRSIDVCASVLMASVSPPAMLPQHRSRFVLIELMKPEAGADHRAEMTALAKSCERAAPSLFARALRSLPLFEASLAQFRAALGRAGCVAREMDQLGAVLSGWWYLVEDKPPTVGAADSSVAAVAPFMRGADAMDAEDAPQAVLDVLFSSSVALDRSTDHASIARLIQRVLSADPEDFGEQKVARRTLERYGLRVVSAEALTARNRAVQRVTSGRGLWVNPIAAPLAALFAKSNFQGQRWLIELRRHRDVHACDVNIRVGALPPRRCLWVDLDAALPPDCEEG